MDFLPENIEQYAEEMTAAEPALLAELSQETWQKVLMPRMLSGHLQGRLLAAFVQMMQPMRILEIGTYTGYSAICMGLAMPHNAQLHTVDINDELEALVKRYLDKAGLTNRVHCHWGDARHVLQNLKEDWDLVFLDADKEHYVDYLDMVLPHLKPGAWVIADNVLWSGKVTKPTVEGDLETAALKAYAQRLRGDDRFDQVLLPVRDGLLLARFLGNP